MKAYELLDDESKWTQGVMARNAAGGEEHPLSPLAVRWCAIGALRRCYSVFTSKFFSAATKLEGVLKCGTQGIGRKNDDPGTTFEEIRNALKEADL